MKTLSNFMETTRRFGYEAPAMVIVSVEIERGFEASDEAGFDGPSYGEEDIEW
jgi:hypothetical protein